MKNKYLSLLTVLFLLSGIILTGCKPQEATKTEATQASVKSGGTLRYALWSSPTGSFHPSFSNNIYDNRIVDLVYEKLINLDENGNYVPSLADKYEVSDDQLIITFHLNKNAKWHDGQPVTADDVAYTFTTIADPDYDGPRFAQIENVEGAKDYKDKKASSVSGIKVIDEHTISFTFSKVFAPGLATFASRGIIPKHVWEKIPVAQWSKSEQLKKPIGSGPFKFKEFVPDQYVELDKYADYNLGEPKLDKIIFKVTNQDTAQSELIKGDLDIAPLSSFKQKDIDIYKNAGITVNEYDGISYQFMGFNFENSTFKDNKVRQALAYAINRKGIVDSVLDGHGKVVNTVFSGGSWANPGEEELSQYSYDGEKAKSLLKEASYEEKDGAFHKDGKPLKLTLKYSTGNKPREQAAVLIQQNLKDIGIELSLESMEYASLTKQLESKNFDLFLLGWSNDIDPDIKTSWYSNPGSIFGKYESFSSQSIDKLIDAGRSDFDQNKRKATYKELAKEFNETVPAVLLYSPNEGVAYNQKLKNYKPGSYYEFSNVQNWYLEQ
ncbi:oligopeptide-binding protein AppA precursor [Clostridium puniceum]|uniref:Oligopeptide-binding protein AppA n=1 Tax=Clostridium puniceum TaxID=29367 RepID=A0A1S8TWW7_9CLOT|nr:peptide-binding protein [Clostridium puniceum]OOM82092.1 oligopeptide-binding protein AppA precursor [Clostridium puniceum]